MGIEMVRHRTIHLAPQGAPENAPTDVVTVEFSRKLQDGMSRKGWNQSELARQATLHLPEGTRPVTRSNISKYVNATEIPTQVKMNAIAAALGVEPAELLDINSINKVNRTTATSLQDLGDGTVWLRINQAVEWPLALKIMAILKGETDE